MKESIFKLLLKSGVEVERLLDENMRKTMVYLTDDQFFSLNQLTKQTNKRMAELIREAVEILIKEKTKDKDYFRFVGIGQGEPNGNTSEKIDEVLKEVFR
jgi:hypothetical protein